MSFRSIFIALVISVSLIVSAFILNSYRPRAVVEQPAARFIKASGQCAECHANQQYSIVHEYELSRHAEKRVTCLACHEPAKGQSGEPHHGFTITAVVTAANCRGCHEVIYQQFVRSRHAASSWAAIYGRKDFSAEQVQLGEKYQPGSVDRGPHPLVGVEGTGSTEAGCVKCHGIGRPNPDGSIGSCTACHTRHTASVEVARLPTTCGQCHMGPDHSQMEIYLESKHGVLFQAQINLLNLSAPPDKLTTREIFVPTCATCHMSGLNGMNVTHNPSERLSYLLASEITARRPGFDEARTKMIEVCLNCHTRSLVERVYRDGDRIVEETNRRVKVMKNLMNDLHKKGLLSAKPFQAPVDFAYFDLWHYYGRTVKHGAFMGGADFVQWHGNYPMMKSIVEIRSMAEDLRRRGGSRKR